jgi:antitoxin component YwqK of YwqJK toxin-antitoxin module
MLSIYSPAQVADTLNRSDKEGNKQGHWIKRYPNGKIQYEGYFKDDMPAGEFRRYFTTDTLQSLLIFSQDGKEAAASLYHPNGYLASKGKYVNQMKEGKWQFFSANEKNYLICEEEYTGNKKNGLSLKFYIDGQIAEKISYIDNIRHGEWEQFYPSGKLFLRTNYIDGKLQGKFEAFFENGKIQFSGSYKNDARNGLWHIYNKDGTVRYKINYNEGIADNPRIYEDASDYLDSLEKNAGKIADPAIIREKW